MNRAPKKPSIARSFSTGHSAIRMEYFGHVGNIRCQRGVGLVELMLALALSLILTLGIVELFIGTKQTYKTEEGIARIQENARFAMKRIADDINASGYMGCMPSAGNVTNVLTMNTGGYDYSRALDSTVANAFTIRRAVGGSSIRVMQPMTNERANILLDNSDPDYAELEQYDVLVISDCSRAAVFMITNDPTSSSGWIQHNTTTVAPTSGTPLPPNPGQSNSDDYLGTPPFGGETNSVATSLRVISTTYNIGTSTAGNNAGVACGVGNERYCSLFVTDPSGTQELIEGVHGLNVAYGLDTDTDLAADRYETNPAAIANWDNVISVRIQLAMNSVHPVPGSGLFNKTIESTFRLRNRAP